MTDLTKSILLLGLAVIILAVSSILHTNSINELKERVRRLERDTITVGKGFCESKLSTMLKNKNCHLRERIYSDNEK